MKYERWHQQNFVNLKDYHQDSTRGDEDPAADDAADDNGDPVKQSHLGLQLHLLVLHVGCRLVTSLNIITLSFSSPSYFDQVQGVPKKRGIWASNKKVLVHYQIFNRFLIPFYNLQIGPYTTLYVKLNFKFGLFSSTCWFEANLPPYSALNTNPPFFWDTL